MKWINENKKVAIAIAVIVALVIFVSFGGNDFSGGADR